MVETCTTVNEMIDCISDRISRIIKANKAFIELFYQNILVKCIKCAELVLSSSSPRTVSVVAK